jgi:hypothetical protein
VSKSRVTTWIRVAALSAVALLAVQSRQTSATTVASAHENVRRLTIGVLLGNPSTRQIVARYVPQFDAAHIPQFMRDETLESLQTVEPGITKDVLRRIYAALAKIPMTSVAAEVSPPPPDGPTNIPDWELDPARRLMPTQLESALHKPLPEQYIWTQERRPDRYSLQPQYFR